MTTTSAGRESPRGACGYAMPVWEHLRRRGTNPCRVCATVLPRPARTTPSSDPPARPARRVQPRHGPHHDVFRHAPGLRCPARRVVGRTQAAAGPVLAHQGEQEICEAWGGGVTLDPAEVDLENEVPALIVAGGLDLVTPPDHGARDTLTAGAARSPWPPDRARLPPRPAGTSRHRLRQRDHRPVRERSTRQLVRRTPKRDEESGAPFDRNRRGGRWREVARARRRRGLWTR
jgi:hypothetical protein